MINKGRHLRQTSDIFSSKSSHGKKEILPQHMSRPPSGQQSGDRSLSRNNSTKDLRKSMDLEQVNVISGQQKQNPSIVSPQYQQQKKVAFAGGNSGKPTVSTTGKKPTVQAIDLRVLADGGNSPLRAMDSGLKRPGTQQGSRATPVNAAEANLRTPTSEGWDEDRVRVELNRVANELNNLIINYNINVTEEQDYTDILEVLGTQLRIIDEVLASARRTASTNVLAMVRNNEGRIVNLVKVIAKRMSEMQQEFESFAQEYNAVVTENNNLSTRLAELESGTTKSVVVDREVTADMRRILEENEQLKSLIKEQENQLDHCRVKENKLVKLLYFIQEAGVDIDKVYGDHLNEINQDDTLDEDDLLDQSRTRNQSGREKDSHVRNGVGVTVQNLLAGGNTSSRRTNQGGISTSTKHTTKTPTSQ